MNYHAIGEQVAQTLSTLPEWENLEEFVTSFQTSWLKLGQILQQQLVQEKIEEIETQYLRARTKRKKRYYTPLGEMVLWRRVYQQADGYQIKVDLELGLPSYKWLAPVLELACALGVSSEFPNAHKLFRQWTGKDWVKLQQQLLKKSEWKQVIKNCASFSSKRSDLQLAITSLERYLTNNQTRIDYQHYLSSGLMIGSGVVESSNRRVVTQRLKQAGMHWSIAGAEGVMALRAIYLSSSNRWSNIWSNRSQCRKKLA